MNLPEKCALPECFQFRVKGHPGFSHTAKRSPMGYSIKWARGWDRYLFDNHYDPDLEPDPAVPNLECHYVEGFVENGAWIIVDDAPKQKDEFPDEFYFRVPRGEVYKFKRMNATHWMCSALNDENDCAPWNGKEIKGNIDSGTWTVCNAPLTAEQQKAVKEMKEQVAALESSIKLNEQDIEHKRRLVGNYTERLQEVVRKIAELEGV